MNEVLAHGSIEIGTVGWIDDGGTYFDQGTGDNDGFTLVRVTLFRGRDPSTSLDQTQAQGQQMLCTIGSGVNRIPPRGTRVLVAIPATHGLIPGAAVIITTMEKSFSETSQFSDKRVVIDYGDVPVIIRGSCVTLQSTASVPQSLSVGLPPAGGVAGISMMDETGSGMVLQSGVLAFIATDAGTPPTATAFVQLKNGEIALAVGGGLCGAKWETSGDAHIFGTNFYAYTAGVYLGALATVANTALWGISGPAAAPSTTVYLSP
jgi:hypothetical protein